MELTVETNCPTQWKFSYESDDPQLEELYELAKRDQWNVTEDINWDRPTRDDCDIIDPAQGALRQTKFFQSLDAETQDRSRRTRPRT